MSCIGLVRVNLSMPCGAPNNGGIGRPVTAKILNASSIESFTVNSGVAKITRVPTERSYDLTASNNSISVSVGLKSQDIIPGAYDVSITFKNFGSLQSELGDNTMGVVGEYSRAEVVIAVDHGGGVYRVYGLGVPLVCTELVGDSTASEYFTYTYGVEDWQVGTTIHSITKAAYDALSTPAPAPTPTPTPPAPEA